MRCLFAVTLAAAALLAAAKPAASAGVPAEAKSVDQLLAEADTALRQGLLRLAKRFPQVQRTDHPKLGLQEYAEGASEAGEIILEIGFYPPKPAKAGIDKPVAEADRWGVTVIVEPAAKEMRQAATFPIFPKLKLRGLVGIWAADPQLDKELKKLVDDALAPLKALEQGQAADGNPARAAPDEIKRSFLIGIIGELGKRKDKYPEFAALDPAALRRQVEAAAADQRGLKYEYRFTPHDNRKIPHFGEHGCAIHVGFGKLGNASATTQTRDLPALGAQVWWYVGVAQDVSPGFRKDVGDVITAAIAAMERRLAGDPAGGNPDGAAAVAAVITLLERPWQEKLTDAQLDEAAANLKPASDEIVDALMAAFNRDGQTFAFRHRSVQILERLKTPKAQAALMDIAMGRSAEPLPSMKGWAARAYIATLADKTEARALLAASDGGVLNAALVAIQGVAVDAKLLDRLRELLQWQNPMAVSYAVAAVLAQDPGEAFAAEKVDAIVKAIAAVPRMADRDKIGFPGNWTLEEISYDRYVGALAQLKGADGALKDATDRAESVPRDILLIARARRGDKTAGDGIRAILNDEKAGMRRAWAARSLVGIAAADDLVLLRRLSESDPLSRPPGTCVPVPGSPDKVFPVREAAAEVIKELEKSAGRE